MQSESLLLCIEYDIENVIEEDRVQDISLFDPIFVHTLYTWHNEMRHQASSLRPPQENDRVRTIVRIVKIAVAKSAAANKSGAAIPVDLARSLEHNTLGKCKVTYAASKTYIQHQDADTEKRVLLIGMPLSTANYEQAEHFY